MHALSLLFALLFFLSTFSINVVANKLPKGFSIDLIHWDSPLSPFYNSSMTQLELVRNAVLHSMSRANRFRLSINEIGELAEIDIIPNNGNYLMKIFIGTPPIERLAIADTGSDLIWVQCSPCTMCYPQNAPLFYPKNSSTYMVVLCRSKPCAALPMVNGYPKCGTSNECVYYYIYGGKSYTMGELATDSINFGTTGGQSVSFPKSLFGCGRNNGLIPVNKDVVGLVGLGKGPLSLVSQLGDQIGRKFSYCFPPFNEMSTTKLRFGEEETISGNGVVSTPLISEPADITPFYYLNLKGITVGQETVSTGQSSGNIVIDSGTTLTILPLNFYYEVEALVKKAIGADKAVVQDPSLNPFKLCYNTNVESIKNFPNFVVHFMGADLALNPENFFRQISNNLPCFAIVPKSADGQPSIYGNMAQFNFDVEYDLDGRKLSFAPANCAKQ